MFSKAPIKRYNDEVNETPAPGDYDPKEAKSRGSKIAHSTSVRFNDASKSVTPGKFPSFKRPFQCSQCYALSFYRPQNVFGSPILLRQTKKLIAFSATQKIVVHAQKLNHIQSLTIAIVFELIYS